MRFTVTYEDGIFKFEVASADEDNDYFEEFEITDLNEAKDTAWELVQDIKEMAEEEMDPFEDLFEGDDE